VPSSHGGVDREPPWWLNLIANPCAELEVGGDRFPIRAEKISDAERPTVWARFVPPTPFEKTYQARVRREIALLRLRRVG
jgi:deazaflavin-dependent oxidoreductase (nitroreductase family)